MNALPLALQVRETSIMQRYIIKSFARSILVLIGSLILVFMMVRITGDPARLMLPREAPPETVEAFKEKMGFNRPLIVQFFDFFSHAIVGDFGYSLHYRLPVMRLVLERLPPTLELGLFGMTIAVVVAIPLGIIGGLKPGTLWDFIARSVGLFGQITPSYWLGMIMIVIFAVELGLLPSMGRTGWKSMIMPAFVLSIGSMGWMVRLTRSSVLEVRGEDYIRTAYSKGLSTKLIYYRHVFRVATLPLISILGISLGSMLGGSFYIETVFAYPGLGRLVVEAISGRDYPLVQGITFLFSVVVVILNLLTDIAYAFIDPRIRYEN
jgi:ABC-type dipeptide/oligopeptide/nickel transport system permease component